MEKLEIILKELEKNEIFIELVKKMFKDNNINGEKGLEIIKGIYK